MFLQALLGAVPARGELDRAALAAHSALLEHGFTCVGAAEPGPGAAPVMSAGADGSASLQIVPAGWNAQPDNYTFGYVHPLRGASETFTMKAVALGGSLMVHASSSVPGAELLTVTLAVDRATTDTDPAAVAVRAKDWQEKVAASIALRLLGLHNSTSRFGKVLAGQTADGAAAAAGGTKRPAPEDERPPRRARSPGEDDPRHRPGISPFTPSFTPFHPDLPGRFPMWTPGGGGGGLLGPRHPAWGQVVPGSADRRGGMLPRFDPIGPGGAEPDPDHMVVPGFRDAEPDHFMPGFENPFGRGGRRPGPGGPDGMFII